MSTLSVIPISYITPVASGMNGIASSPALGTVAVGNGGAILSWNGASYDPTYGIPLWTPQVSGVSTDLLGVCWSNALQGFVVCGRGGVILTSPDTINWTAAAAVTSADLHSVAENSGILLAVGAGGVAISSIDGASWRLKDVPPSLTAQKLILTVPKGVA